LYHLTKFVEKKDLNRRFIPDHSSATVSGAGIENQHSFLNISSQKINTRETYVQATWGMHACKGSCTLYHAAEELH